MKNPETYEQKEQRIFNQVFPTEEIKKIQEKGNRPLDPFKTLAHFGMEIIDTKEAKDLVLAEISATDFGPQINMIDYQGQVKIYAQDIVPFLRAAAEIYINTINFWKDEAKAEFNRLFT
jgi:hypothetical protein